MRPLIPALVLALLAVGSLTGCTGTSTAASDGTPAPTATDPATTDPATGGEGGGALPGCEQVAAEVATITTGLTYDPTVSLAQTAPEAYPQRVCVWVSPDGGTQVGVTIAAIPFLETELQSYATLPNAISDDRLALHGAVLQTLQADDPADGHLDGPLYLFDLEYSVTIQGATTGVSSQTLPQLTMADSTDAAFAVRELVR